MANQPTGALRLHADPRSSSSLRVLCYLRHKALAVTLVPVRLGEGEHRSAHFLALNPAAAVPVLELPDGQALTQSLAILEYLEALHPQPPLLPAESLAAARVRSLCALVAADLHPVTNMRVRRAVAQAAGDDAATAWVRDFTLQGLAAVEAAAARHGGAFSVGDAPTLADFFVAPALFNARRFGVGLDPFPALQRVQAACLALPAFEPLR
ncbi:maleylacetoacetate isomerase [Aquabacterium sp. J223]|uniref:maleylacetoacetate isomerase n=1 Tax=Aquabacterium sp. J223 TaxID=2898431 RepID=UPI0021ADC1F5|nr:maleylacetoacetate isomerase [Aquabacterium sp. J223]UUX94549.1 maleylacetoacetate isomerase [Aquabacterium sp. J223]